MRLKADETFFDQAARFDLRCACEECAYFDEAAGACIHGYPNDEHLARYHAASPAWIVPCKDFELA